MAEALVVQCYLCPLFTRASDALKVALPRESSTPKPILRNSSNPRSQHCNAYSHLPTTAEACLLTTSPSVRPHIATSASSDLPCLALARYLGRRPPLVPIHLIFIYSRMTPAPSDWIFLCISPSFQYSTPTTSTHMPHAALHKTMH